MAARNYDEKDVAAILQRAAELQIEAPGHRSMSLEEIERVAAEAGMDAALVRRAAAELSRNDAPEAPGWLRRLLGGPSRLKWEFEVDGEIDASAHEAILEAIHSTLSEPGSASATGRTLSWNIINQTRNFGLTVTPRNGRTLVRIEDRLGNLIGGVFGGVFGGVGGGLTPLLGIAGGALLGGIGVGAAVTLGLLGSYGLTRAIYGGITRKRERKLHLLADAIRTAVEDSVGDSALTTARERHGLAASPSVEIEEPLPQPSQSARHRS